MADPTPAGDNPESVPATKPAALTGLDFLRRASAAPVLVSPSAPTVVFPSSGPEAPTIWTQGECSMHAGAAALPRVTAASTPAAAASTPNAAASTPDAAASTPDAAASTPAAPEPTWNPEAALKANRRIDDNKKVKDVEKERLLALFETALFIAKSDAPIEMYVDLVQHLAQRGTPGFPKSSYGAYYTMEALAAKEAAKALPELGIIVAVIRAVAEDLGRSSYSNRKFKELQEVFMHTNLDVQGIHSVRWLSRGDAIARFVRVLPAIIVMLEESDKTMYHLVTLFKIHYFLFFLADVHTALNALNLLFQKRQVGLTAVHSQVRRTIIYMEQRYLNCGQQFGGGTSKLLSAFLARHASPDCREVTVEGVDKEGQPRVHKFQLHEEAVKGYTTSSGDMQGCYACCRSFARKLVYNLELRLGDLTRLNGAKLFMPRSRPRPSVSGQEAGHDLACRADSLPANLVLDIWRSTRKRHPGKRKEQAAPEKERAKAKFVKGSGRRVVEEEDLDEGMCGSAGDGSESDDDASSSGDDAGVSSDEYMT
ncbi:unnamed protein product [Closterium sp. NIES-54]